MALVHIEDGVNSPSHPPRPIPSKPKCKIVGLYPTEETRQNENGLSIFTLRKGTFQVVCETPITIPSNKLIMIQSAIAIHIPSTGAILKQPRRFRYQRFINVREVIFPKLYNGEFAVKIHGKETVTVPAGHCIAEIIVKKAKSGRK
jgi:hypothetical protein